MNTDQLRQEKPESSPLRLAMIDELAQLRTTIATLEQKLREEDARVAELEKHNEMLKELTRISDEAFNFHLKRGNDYMEQVNKLESALRECKEALESALKTVDIALTTAKTCLGEK